MPYSIQPHDIRRKVNHILLAGNIQAACDSLDTYLHTLNLVSRNWFCGWFTGIGPPASLRKLNPSSVSKSHQRWVSCTWLANVWLVVAFPGICCNFQIAAFSEGEGYSNLTGRCQRKVPDGKRVSICGELIIAGFVPNVVSMNKSGAGRSSKSAATGLVCSESRHRVRLSNRPNGLDGLPSKADHGNFNNTVQVPFSSLISVLK